MHYIRSVKTICCVFFALVPLLFSQAQERCGTVVYQKQLQQQNLWLEGEQQFEQWIKERIQLKQKTFQTHRTQATYTIPVVVHVIHMGEVIGSGTNISDVQILSQISVLNKDYNRQNTDAGNTPSEFLSVAGSLDIEFVLAKRDPEGLPTDGIVRVNGGKSAWTSNENYKLKSLSYWPAEDYLNIWVCNITDFLGYAQLPQSTQLIGLENASTNRLTDGVVINYKTFGSIDDGNFVLETKYNKGRTATHEIGHFFGLRHIWGDDGGACNNQGDYVDDTPDQSGSTSNCPTHPRTTCNVASMFQNFMDYTNDGCMNIFTQGQVNRMKVVLENSPRRKSLLTSPGSQEPQPVPNDLGIRQIISPDVGECTGSVAPVIEIRNYGSNAVTSTQIQMKKNGNIEETKNFTINLGQLEATTVSFANIPLTTGNQSISFEILQTNGTIDGNSSNNSKEKIVNVPGSIGVPFIETFNTVPENWRIVDPDNIITWKLETFTQSNGSTKAMKMDFYNYEDNLGEIDLLIAPKFDLTSAPVALLLFDVAYAQYSSPLSNDGLKVVMLNNCNTDINQGTVIYSKSGSDLKTTNPTSNSFTPANTSQWRTESVNLGPYLGQNNLQLAFVGLNDWGNNLYLDNVRIITDNFENITLKDVIEPSPVTCYNTIKPALLVQNSGTDIFSFKVNYQVNNNSFSIPFQTTNQEPLIKAGQEIEIELPTINLTTGQNNLQFHLADPNNKIDLEPSDNSKAYNVVVSAKTQKIPLRENFEGDWQQHWTSSNPSGVTTWSITTLNDNTDAIFFEAFNNISTDHEAWLVSPTLDFSKVAQASLSFDYSYARRDSKTEQLQILASTDCGVTFDILLAEYTGLELADTIVETSWKPTKPSHWKIKERVSLEQLVGKKETMLAFVVQNANGNNLYLDNIEIFLTDDPAPVPIKDEYVIYPNPFPHPSSTDIRITFRLPELEESVTVEIMDALGKKMKSEQMKDVLNQTYYLNMQNAGAGMYLVRIRTTKKVYIDKLIIK